MARPIVFLALIGLMRSFYVSQALQGQPEDTHGLSFMAFLTKNKRGADGIVCSASIIHDSFVLTAASCFYSNKGRPISYQHQVLIADDYMDIKQLIPHPHYWLRSGNFDVGLIRLVDKIAFGPRVNKIMLAHREDLPVGSVASTACRLLSGNSRAESTYIMPRSSCNNVNLFGRYITGNMLCARTTRANINTCAVDSGAPLFQDGQQYGVASRQYEDNIVFTKLLNQVRWWIVTTVLEGNVAQLFGNYVL